MSDRNVETVITDEDHDYINGLDEQLMNWQDEVRKYYWELSNRIQTASYDGTAYQMRDAAKLGSIAKLHDLLLLVRQEINKFH